MVRNRGISIRLDERKREKLVRLLLVHRFYDEIVELVKARKAFALQLYNDGLGAKKRKTIAAIPEGWLPKFDSIKAGLPAAGMVDIDFNGRFSYGEGYDLNKILEHDARMEKVEMPFPNNTKGLPLKAYDNINDPIVTKWEHLRYAQEDLSQRVSKACELARTYIWKAGSTGALKEMWPEMTEFCAQLEGVVGNQLPAIPTQELNMVFKLPPEKRKRAA